MTIAFGLSGGGSLDAVQVGMLQAATERQVIPRPDKIYESTRKNTKTASCGLPLQYPDGVSTRSLGLTGEETMTITGMQALNDGTPSTVRVMTGSVEFDAVVRADTPAGATLYRHGGILLCVLRQLLDQETPS